MKILGWNSAIENFAITFKIWTHRPIANNSLQDVSFAFFFQNFLF